MLNNKHGPPRKALWAYAYDIVPAQAEDGLDTIQRLLDEEHDDALRGKRTWAGRIVFDPQMTHILIVSDDPQQGREVNRKLEAEMMTLKMGFALTVPLSVPDDRPPPPHAGDPSSTTSTTRPRVPGKNPRRGPLE
jgi:hypothetical protein